MAERKRAKSGKRTSNDGKRIKTLNDTTCIPKKTKRKRGNVKRTMLQLWRKSKLIRSLRILPLHNHKLHRERCQGRIALFSIHLSFLNRIEQFAASPRRRKSGKQSAAAERNRNRAVRRGGRNRARGESGNSILC